MLIRTHRLLIASSFLLIAILSMAQASFAASDETMNKVLPSIVLIKTKRAGAPGGMMFVNSATNLSFRQSVITLGQGMGFVIDPDGYILTAAHVVSGTMSIQVNFSDGSQEDAKLLGVDYLTDTAVIKVNKTGLKPLDMGDSSAMKPDDKVKYVLPSGAGYSTFTGKVLSVNERLNYCANLIKVHGAIEPGTSGMPVFDSSGNVIAVCIKLLIQPFIPLRKPPASGNEPSKDTNVKVYGGSPRLYYVWYAVKINSIKLLLNSLKTGSSIMGIERGYLGVMPVDKGGKIKLQVDKNSPAAKAGIKNGDALLTANNLSFKSAEDFRNYICSLRPGDRVNLLLEREGKRVEVSVVLEKRRE